MPAPPPESEPAIVSAIGRRSWRARRRDPLARARLGIGVQRDVGDDGDDIGAGGQAGLPRSTLSPPIATSGIWPTRLFHSPMRSRPCGPNFIAFRIVG